MSFHPAEWLCAVLSIGGPAEAFKVIGLRQTKYTDGPAATVRSVIVLHKESGAHWRFDCTIDREGA